MTSVPDQQSAPTSETKPNPGPLDGLVVVDLSQFLAGPYAALRLQDLGARVIKVERPNEGDLCRQLYLSDTVIDGESTLFHAINRGKESIALDLKSPGDRAILTGLIEKADVLLQNFRPGVIARLGFPPERVLEINSRIVYGSVSGYGESGAWAEFPGQDLLAQARSGVMWLNGNFDDGPVPIGLPVADILAGANLAHGVLAALVRRGVTGRGGLVETSLLESLIDFQFEVLATYLNDGGRPPKRSSFRSAHAGLAAPYGVYPTSDGFLAIAMTPLGQLTDLLGIEELHSYVARPESWFSHRDEIKRLIALRLVTATTAHWLSILEPEGVWCSPVLDWAELLGSEAMRRLDMIQLMKSTGGTVLRLMRSPIRVDGIRGQSARAAPALGRDRQAILKEFGLDHLGSGS